MCDAQVPRAIDVRVTRVSYIYCKLELMQVYTEKRLGVLLHTLTAAAGSRCLWGF